MEKPLHIVFLQDDALEVVQVRHQLSVASFAFDLKQVSTKEQFIAELENCPDLILSDHTPPPFDGFTALTLARSLCPEVPFIFVTGPLGEDLAVKAFQNGAADIVRKDRLPDLLPAIDRALQTTRDQRDHAAAEQHLSKNEEMFRLLVERVSDYAICMLDPQGRVLTWNAGAECISGYRPDEILGEFYGSFFLPEDVSANRPQNLLKLAAEEGRAAEQIRQVRKNGTHYHSFTVLTAIRDQQHGLQSYSLVVRDITERKKWEDALKRNEAFKTAILESALDAIVAIDADGNVLEWNPAAERIFGYRHQDVVGKEMAQFIVPRWQLNEHRQAMQRYLVTGESAYLGRRRELIAMRADGTEFPVELTVVRIPHEYPPKFTGFIRDITNRKLAEAALRKSEDQFRLAVEAAEDYGIYLLDTDGRVASWNAGAERIHGYSVDEVLGHHFSMFFLPEEVVQDLPNQELGSALANGVSRREAWSQRKNGSRFYSQCVLTAVRDPAGELTGYLRVIHDITERRQSEEQISRLNTELEERVRQRTLELQESNRELEAFSYSVSHDLRAPLRHIDGFVNLLRQSVADKLDPASAEYLQIISQEAKQMNKLIDALLAFSRTSRAPLRKSRVDLNAVLKLVQDDLRFDIDGRQIDWVLHPLPAVQGDLSLLRQVLVNLLSNALKYTRKREVARIEVSATDTHKEVIVKVRDNGVGFDMQFADKLFGVFQRLHGPEEFEGIGIGLANVRRIIQRHGGRTWAEAAPGDGAAFYFSLPN